MHWNSNSGSVTAILGSTNSGKTLYAIEQMLSHRNGVIGLPLRLLAREVYDKVVERCGPSIVALVTGEERIVPNRTAYWICTTEAMPIGIGTDFLAVDEIQLCGDKERGHIFTDRLLNARGTKATLFMGSDTIKATIKSLIPNVIIENRSRLSKLTYTGYKKVSRLVPRTACIGFSIEEVYMIAEQIRQRRGGAAVVMGALSPRTRNAQVDLYENGDVDFIVATDAIGMGLNLDINHVAFGSLSKFDGHCHRVLTPIELGQISGRAGRFKHNGTFGVTADSYEIPPDIVKRIEAGSYKPTKILQWRNSDLDFVTVDTLIRSLTLESSNPQLRLTKNSVDVLTLSRLVEDKEFVKNICNPPQVKVLWEVCQLPDYRNFGLESHARMVRTLFNFVGDGGYITENWLGQELEKIASLKGSINAISTRLAAIRTWNYVAQKPDWVENPMYWREKTRHIEDQLSDALHLKLKNRFVDIQFSVLLKTLKQKEQLLPSISNQGEVVVDELMLGTLKGFRFYRSTGKTSDEEKALKKATQTILSSYLSELADTLSKAPKDEFSISEVGEIIWKDNPVGVIKKSHDPYFPSVKVIADDIVLQNDKDKIKSRLEVYLYHSINDELENLIKLKNDESLEGDVKGFAFQLVQSFGILKRSQVKEEVTRLDQEKRRLLRGFGVRFGQYTIYDKMSIKPQSTHLRLVLWAVNNGIDCCPIPKPGLTTHEAENNAPEGYYPVCGFYQIGNLAIRVDILERLMNLLREEDSRKGFEAKQAMTSIIGVSNEKFATLMKDLGYQVTKEERDKISYPSTKELDSNECQVEPEKIEGVAISSNELKQSKDSLPQQSAIELLPNTDLPISEPKTDMNQDVIQEYADSSIDIKAAQLKDDSDVSQEMAEKKIIYTFKWVPRKPRKRPFKSNEATNQAERKNLGNEFEKPSRKKRPKRRKRQNEDTIKQFKERGKKIDKEFKIDPDHPFAALQELRAKL